MCTTPISLPDSCQTANATRRSLRGQCRIGGYGVDNPTKMPFWTARRSAKPQEDGARGQTLRGHA